MDDSQRVHSDQGCHRPTQLCVFCVYTLPSYSSRTVSVLSLHVSVPVDPRVKMESSGIESLVCHLFFERLLDTGVTKVTQDLREYKGWNLRPPVFLFVIHLMT